jgi:phosphoglycerate dehydrogenase-like enzyme
MVNRETLGLMKPTAWLINAARGPLVDEAALIEALLSGKLEAAGLDVQLHEPPDRTNPLLTHQSIIKTTFLLYHAAVSAIAGG